MLHLTIRDHFEAYLKELAPTLGHADRVSNYKGYCYGLMLSLPRKSIEPIATIVDPAHVQARHQALHHPIAKSPWSDHALLTGVAQWVLLHLQTDTSPTASSMIRLSARRAGIRCVSVDNSVERSASKTTIRQACPPTCTLPPSQISICSRFAKRWRQASRRVSCWPMPPMAREQRGESNLPTGDD